MCEEYPTDLRLWLHSGGWGRSPEIDTVLIALTTTLEAAMKRKIIEHYEIIRAPGGRR